MDRTTTTAQRQFLPVSHLTPARTIEAVRCILTRHPHAPPSWQFLLVRHAIGHDQHDALIRKLIAEGADQ